MSSNLHLMPLATVEKFKQSIEDYKQLKQKEQDIRDNCVCKSLSLPACGTCDVKIKELLNGKV